jgi:hypothetical protein
MPSRGRGGRERAGADAPWSGRAVLPVTVGHPLGCGPGLACQARSWLDGPGPVCSAWPGRRGREGPTISPQPLSGAGPLPPPHPRSRRRHPGLSPAGRGRQVTAPGQQEPQGGSGHDRGGGGLAGNRPQHDQGHGGGDESPEDEAERSSVADALGDHQHGVDPLEGRDGPGGWSGSGNGGHRGGGAGLAAGAVKVSEFGEIGVGFAAAPGGAELGVGGGGGGVPGDVAAVGPVGVGGGGNLPPGGADGFVVQVGAGGQAEGGEPGRARARLTARSRRVRSSSPGVSLLTSCSRVGTADVLALVLLGYHVGEILTQLLARAGVGRQRFHGESFFERPA